MGAGNYSASKIAASKIAGSKIAGPIIAWRDYSSTIIAWRDYSSPFCPRRTVFVGDYEVDLMRCLFVCLSSVCLKLCHIISFEPDFRILWNFAGVVYRSIGLCVPIFKKIHKLLLPFAYYFCSNILLGLKWFT